MEKDKPKIKKKWYSNFKEEFYKRFVKRDQIVLFEDEVRELWDWIEEKLQKIKSKYPINNAQSPSSHRRTMEIIQEAKSIILEK